MKLTTCLLVLLANTAAFAAYHPDLLDYPLRIIEYLDGGGRFECVFFSASQLSDSILNDLLQHARLRYVAKYVLQGSYRPKTLPKKPSVLLLEPGRRVDLKRPDTPASIMRFLLLFHPATKVLVFLDFSNVYVREMARLMLVRVKCTNVVFFDTESLAIRLGSLENLVEIVRFLPHPKYVFEWFKQELLGPNITFVAASENPDEPTFRWVLTTALYLKGGVCEIPKQKDGTNIADIVLEGDIAIDLVEDFWRVFIYEPVVESVLVPRGELLNALEVMLMPFQWQVWTLLVVVLTLAEIIKRFFPELFRNDPILLVVCGFERYNLHQAKRWERIILHSMIILMFFITSAFETKIISLMVDNPSAPSAKKLSDFDEFGLKFHFNLEENPAPANHPVIGKYVVHDPFVYSMWSNEPGEAKYINQELAALVQRLSYDFRRGKSWYVELDEKFLVHPVQIYYTAYRSPFLETFKFTYGVLGEAGIMGLWRRQYGQLLLSMIWGLRPRIGIAGSIYLKFDDMLLAWIVLSIGYGISLVGFIMELVEKKLKVLLKRPRV